MAQRQEMPEDERGHFDAPLERPALNEWGEQVARIWYRVQDQQRETEPVYEEHAVTIGGKQQQVTQRIERWTLDLVAVEAALRRWPPAEAEQAAGLIHLMDVTRRSRRMPIAKPGAAVRLERLHGPRWLDRWKQQVGYLDIAPFPEDED